MTALTAFYEYVLPEVPGCSTTTALQYIRLACEEFYSRTLVKRIELADISTVADTVGYALTLPSGYVAVKITKAWLDDNEIDPIGPDDKDGLYSDWRTVTGEPKYVYLSDTDTAGFLRTPDGVYTATLEVALKPKSDGSNLDTWVFEQYREGIANGAKAKLLAMPKKQWSDPAMSVVYRDKFNIAIDNAMRAHNKGHARAPKRTRSVFGLR